MLTISLFELINVLMTAPMHLHERLVWGMKRGIGPVICGTRAPDPANPCANYLATTPQHPDKTAKPPGIIRGKTGPGLKNKTIRNNHGIIRTTGNQPSTLGFSRPLYHPASYMDPNGKRRIWRIDHE
jgi:hypothetical protein